jgi:hypothetical protein
MTVKIALDPTPLQHDYELLDGFFGLAEIGFYDRPTP